MRTFANCFTFKNINIYFLQVAEFKYLLPNFETHIWYFQGIHLTSDVFSSHCTLVYTPVLQQFKRFLRDWHT